MKSSRPTPLLVLLAAVLLVLLSMAIAGCRAGTEARAMDDEPAPKVSTGPSPASRETPASQELSSLLAFQEYKEELALWLAHYQAQMEQGSAEALDFVDPYFPTQEEIARARAFTDSLRTSLQELKAIAAPAELSQTHARLYSSLYGLVVALDRMITAIQWGSARDAELAYREADEANQLWLQAMAELSPYLEPGDVIQN